MFETTTQKMIFYKNPEKNSGSQRFPSNRPVTSWDQMGISKNNATPKSMEFFFGVFHEIFTIHFWEKKLYFWKRPYIKYGFPNLRFKHVSLVVTVDPRIQGFKGQSPSSQHVTDHHGDGSRDRRVGGLRFLPQR